MADAAQLSVFLDRAIAVAREAGALIRSAYIGRSHIVDFKEANASDLVTQTDRAVEELVVRSLAATFPGHAFIGEESTSDAFQTAAGSAPSRCKFDDRPTWIIDPIDGTMNFFHGFPYTAVSIGLCINRQPVVGVIFNPILDQLYYASKGAGAFLLLPASADTQSRPLRLPLAPQPLPKSLETALISTEYGSSKENAFLVPKIASIQRIVTKPVAGRGIRSIGSAALSMCLLAEGAVDVYYEAGTHAWDICAGVVIVRESGGMAINWILPSPSPASTDALTDKIDAVRESIDVMARTIMCVRSVRGEKEPTAITKSSQVALASQLGSLLSMIDYPHD